MSDSSNKWSLQAEIKKRKTQELLRELEAKQRPRLMAPKQSSTASAPPSNPSSERIIQTALASKRTTQLAKTASTPQPTTSSRRTLQSTPASKRTTQLAASISHSPRWIGRQRRIAVGAALLAITVCLLTGLIVNSVPLAQPALTPLPKASIGTLLDYLESVGVPIRDLQTFSAPNETWSAREEIQFRVNRVYDQGIFVVLSYDSPGRASLDSFKATFHRKFKTWKLMQVSNMLLLASPETADPLVEELASHVTQYLVAPYRSFIPTATPRKVKQQKASFN